MRMIDIGMDIGCSLHPLLLTSSLPSLLLPAGLRNKREVYRVNYTLSKVRSVARSLLTLPEKVSSNTAGAETAEEANTQRTNCMHDATSKVLIALFIYMIVVC